jgi:hypothetical protein
MATVMMEMIIVESAITVVYSRARMAVTLSLRMVMNRKMLGVFLEGGNHTAGVPDPP